MCWTSILGQPTRKACVEVSRIKLNQTPGKIAVNIIISHPFLYLMLTMTLPRGYNYLCLANVWLYGGKAKTSRRMCTEVLRAGVRQGLLDGR